MICFGIFLFGLYYSIQHLSRTKIKEILSIKKKKKLNLLKLSNQSILPNNILSHIVFFSLSLLLLRGVFEHYLVYWQSVRTLFNGKVLNIAEYNGIKEKPTVSLLRSEYPPIWITHNLFTNCVSCPLVLFSELWKLCFIFYLSLHILQFVWNDF